MRCFHVIAAVSGLLLTGALLLGCELIGEDKEAAKVDLAGTEWRLESFVIGDQVEAVEEGQRYTISFVSDSTVMGWADCNLCTGGYELFEQDSIRIVIGCNRESCNRSSEFQGAINTSFRYEVPDSKLILYYIDFFTNEDSQLIFIPNKY
jgi:hypothetical protein